MRIADYRLGFLGFGHMAQIMLRAIEAARLVPRSQILFVRRDPAKSRQNEKEFGVTATSLAHLVDQSDILFLCIRPNQAESVLRDLARLKIGSKGLISVMAGIKIASIQKWLGQETQIARIMPNIASSIQEGMTLLSHRPHAAPEFKSAAHLLLTAMGQVIEIDETQMDIGCGMSGSGPAYVFHLIEAMARQGEKEGIPYDKGLKIAAQTFAGAAKMILKGEKPEHLLLQISTPGGTTAAGLKILKEQNLEQGLKLVVSAAAARSRELSEEYS